MSSLPYRISTWLILGLVGLVYLSHMSPNFVDIDFGSYETILYTNEFLEASWRLLTDMGGNLVPGYYAPLSSMTLIFDKALIGSELPDARITLIVNLLFHCLNGALLVLLLTRLGSSAFVAILASAIFLLHPIQTPCIMWFAERKTVMAACFTFLSYLAYLKYRRSSGGLFYALSLLAFAGGLLSKPTAVVLPVVLLIGEWLGRHGAAVPTLNNPDRPKGLRHWSDRTGLLPLVPFFALAVALSLVAIGTEPTDATDYPIVQRLLIASTALWFYIYKIVLPLNLVALYPKWDVNPGDYLWWIPLILLVFSASALVKYRRRISRQFWWGLSFLVVPLLPVLGFIKFGYFQHSYVGNHLAYLSMAGAGFCLALLAEGLLHRAGTRLGTLVGASLVSYMAFLFVLTWQQAAIWNDPIGIWRHTVAMCSSCVRPRLALAHALRGSNQLEQAAREYEEILRMVPTHVGALNDLALVRLGEDRPEDAAQLLRKAIAHNPGSIVSETNLAVAFFRQGRAQEAMDLLQRLTHQKPLFVRPYLVLGQALIYRKAYTEAERLLREALAINPYVAEAYATLAEASLEQGKLEEAWRLARRAVRLRADSAMAYNALGQVALEQARHDESVELFRRALRFQPKTPEIHLNLGAAFMALERFPEARESFEAAIHLRPQFAEGHANLGFAQMNLGNTSAAIEHLRKALEIKPSLTAAREALERAQETSATTSTGTP
ncbi:MAG: tetratricopeptide repeat protein [Thermodesulfobacteriota bacterium]